MTPVLDLEIGPMDLKFPALPQLAALKQALALSGNPKSISGPWLISRSNTGTLWTIGEDSKKYWNYAQFWTWFTRHTGECQYLCSLADRSQSSLGWQPSL